jgi:hypothetical protein
LETLDYGTNKKVMKTLTLENINESDLNIFLSLAKRLKIKAKVSEMAVDENQITDCINPNTGEYMTVKELQQTVAQAEKEIGVSKEEFTKHLDKWQKKLSA